MPSSPKIKKEDMLQAALELVARDGYAALNIKAVARELGCSTAPISWQFGGMDGLREELIPFAEQYVEDKYYSRNENELATFEQRGKGTIDLALENPNLFRFLYTGERSQLLSTGFELQTNNQDTANVYQEMADYTKTGNGFCDDNDGVYTGDRNSYCIRNCQRYEGKYVSYAS